MAHKYWFGVKVEFVCMSCCITSIERDAVNSTTDDFFTLKARIDAYLAAASTAGFLWLMDRTWMFRLFPVHENICFPLALQFLNYRVISEVISDSQLHFRHTPCEDSLECI